ncbi:SIMPL domain-containing protein [Actinomadura rupiterrae]|uniref:SIMPL domain-containing protein n=1 Tax=Actinomadura rupiterrae TaxID=559627 RepID=UPI0020A4AF29|nr:SIMPL domain-containing protein [Actinomadura rupiterrae]MCP2341106.1 hypothetical protein [Actinomadura rupiterrae]
MLADPNISQPWGVSVFGAATVAAEPDFARVKVELGGVEPSPAEAFQRAQDLIADFRGVLRAHGIPAAGVSPSRLVLTTNYEYNPRTDARTQTGYSCKARFEIETDAVDSLQRLLVEIVEAGVNGIDDITFDARAKPELRARARREAVAAARAKAELYAEAAGVRLGRVLHIEDIDPEGLKTRTHSGLVGGIEGDLAPGQIVVSAAVSLGFAIAD